MYTLPPVELRGFSQGSAIKTADGLRWTVRLGRDTGTITTYVVPGNAPFLLSRRVLEAMEAQLDLSTLTLSSNRHGMHKVPLRQAANGHLLLNLCEPAPEVNLQPEQPSSSMSSPDHPEAGHEDCHECETELSNEPNTNPIADSDNHRKRNTSRSETNSRDLKKSPQKIVEKGTCVTKNVHFNML